jgi:hypothetical protein
MFLRRTIAQGQKEGHNNTPPKQQHSDTPEDFRPITLLNAEYKLLARILATRLVPVLEDFVNPFQYCGVPRNTILDAVSTIRDVIAYAETTNTPLCVIRLDFRQDFDISHIYLYRILEMYGISPWFIARIKMLYKGATGRLHLNGTTVGHIPIQCGVRQGCPLSMALYALCLHPFVKRLHDSLVGIKMGRQTVGTKVIA